jgi:hypothetical protein
MQTEKIVSRALELVTSQFAIGFANMMAKAGLDCMDCIVIIIHSLAICKDKAVIRHIIHDC